MSIFNRLRRKTVYILPSANASMVSQYANGFRDGRTQGYAAGVQAARDAVAALRSDRQDVQTGYRRALAAIDGLQSATRTRTSPHDSSDTGTKVPGGAT